MNKSNSTRKGEAFFDALDTINIYIPLFIITVGFIGNTASLIIFRIEPDLRKMSSMVFLSFCCVTDSLSLITWNMNHFLKPIYAIELEFINIHTCKFFQFSQYFSLQASAILLAFVCVDRYLL